MNKYSGEPRLDEKILKKKVQHGTYFLCSCNDLFADVPDNIIVDILEWAREQNCAWIIQTKDPLRMLNYDYLLPENSIVGTTIETNRSTVHISKAIPPASRAEYISRFRPKTFVTIEPILKFDLEPFLGLIKTANPCWINIGADSKNSGLPEPTKQEVEALITGISVMGIPIRKKTNLDRILNKG
jgi:hypothetical protein